jgi:low affinity Fe/Cu permease
VSAVYPRPAEVSVRGMPATGFNSVGGHSATGGNGTQVRVPRQTHRTPFDRFAERASQFVSKGLFFTIAVVVVAIWMPTIFFFGSIDTWQLVINTLTSVLAFLLIALLQNSERRYDEALHHKIDALAVALADLMEHQARGDREMLQRHIDELRHSVGLERDA